MAGNTIWAVLKKMSKYMGSAIAVLGTLVLILSMRIVVPPLVVAVYETIKYLIG